MPNYNDFFGELGVPVEYVGKSKPSVGVTLGQSGGKTIVKGIRSGSAAEDAGLSVNDEIIGCNGLRADKKSLEDFFVTLNVGDEIQLLISRDQELYSIAVTVTPYEKPRFKYTYDAADLNKLGEFWLRKDN